MTKTFMLAMLSLMVGAPAVAQQVPAAETKKCCCEKDCCDKAGKGKADHSSMGHGTDTPAPSTPR